TEADGSIPVISEFKSTGAEVIPGSPGQFFATFILVENHSTHAKKICEFMRDSMASVNMCVKVC
ncbi:hypothetical protein EK904_003909, partial [Melospiza melodia maxima]